MNYLIQNEVDRSMIEIPSQNKFNTFDYGYKISKLIRIDRNEMNRQLYNWADLWARELEGKR